MAEVNLFTFINQIQYKRRTVPYDKKIANAYILSLWLSMDKELIGKVNKINKFQFLLPDEIIYEYYMSVIPQGKRFIKFSKKQKDEEMEDRIKKLKESYPEMSTREAKMVVSYLKNKTVKEK